MKELQDILDMLNYKCWYYETAQQAGTCSIHDSMQKEKVPEKYHIF